jgi:two-component system chemotaxis response regulator CheY
VARVTFGYLPQQRKPLARKILLADDSVTAQNMGRKILADAGYEVITVNNGSAALKKIAEHKPDLIVLDVYMPGYSGLEVCQRLKDAQETARVPVLLTVGKLEPFKPEEAKRARADGFIVKPFEASELLSALSKLEDKIVPRAESKPGRFARANAALDEGRYDKTVAIEEDSSWKNRIAFPKKKTEPAPEETDDSEIYNPVNKDLRTVVERRAEKPYEAKPYEAKAEETLVDLGALAPEGLPKDVTAEEIAALAAAAAQVKGKIAEARIEEVKIEEVKAAEGAAEGKSAASEVMLPQENVAATLAAQKPEEKIEEKAEETLAAKIEAAAEKPAEAAQEVASIAAPSIAAPSHADLMSAIASLETDAVATAEKSSGSQDSAYPNLGAGSWSRSGAEVDEPVTMAVAAGAGETFAAVSRWNAVAVALAPEEAAVSLEEEMQKAQAALAAADGGQAGAVATILSPLVESQAQSSHAETLESQSAPASTSASASASTPAIEASSAEVAVAPAAPTETPALSLPATQVQEHVQEAEKAFSAAASVPANVAADTATDAISAAVQELEAVAAAYAEQMKPAPVAPQPSPVKDFVIAGTLVPEALPTAASGTATDISTSSGANTETSSVVSAAPALDIPPAESPKPEPPQTPAEGPQIAEATSGTKIEARIEEPKIEASRVEESKIEESRIEEAKIEKFQIEESKVEETKAAESKINEVKIEEARIEEANTEEVKSGEVKTADVKSEDVRSEISTPVVAAAAALEPTSLAAAATPEKTPAPVSEVAAEGSSATPASLPSTSSEIDSSKFSAASIFSSGIVSSYIDMAAAAFNDLAAGGISDMAKKESEIAANTAAAWANWRRIRETDPKAVAPSGAPEKEEPTASAPPDAAAMAVAAGAEKAFEEGRAAIDSEPDDIASIVDSVLADLRPKIVEEISRKMGKKK